MNVPEDTPLTTEPKCVWQLPRSIREQWRMFRRHDRPEAGIALPSPSTAEPENAIVSPVAHVKSLVGASIVGFGALPAVIGIVTVSLAPSVSVTRSCAL